MGYAISTDRTDITIYSNVFHSDRHDIASTGQPGNAYDAYCNTVIDEFHSEIAFQLNGPDGGKVWNIQNDGSGNTNLGKTGEALARYAGNMAWNFDVHPQYYCDNDVFTYGLCAWWDLRWGRYAY